MSHENVEVLRRVLGIRIDALDDQVVDRGHAGLHPEVEFREDPKFPEASV
jgi:hypothetical protein